MRLCESCKPFIDELDNTEDYKDCNIIILSSFLIIFVARTKNKLINTQINEKSQELSELAFADIVIP